MHGLIKGAICYLQQYCSVIIKMFIVLFNLLKRHAGICVSFSAAEQEGKEEEEEEVEDQI
jgi:hypothetical protein